MSNETFLPENYVKEEFELNGNKARLLGLFILLICVIIFGIPFYFLWPENIQLFQGNIEWHRRLINIGIFVLCAIIGIIVHELIHGFFAAIFNKNGFKSIKFGVLPSRGMAYCANTEILRKDKYIIGLIMPGILLGIIPSLISIMLGNLYVLIFGILFTLAACGDLLLLMEIRKLKKDSWIEDKIFNNEVKINIYKKPQTQERFK